MRIIEENKEIKELRVYISKNLKNSNTLYKYIVEAAEKILKYNIININIIVKNQKIFKKLLNSNKEKIDDFGLLNIEISEKIIQKLKNYYNSVIFPKKELDSYRYDYVKILDDDEIYNDNELLSDNIDLEDLKNNVIILNSDATYMDILQNLFYNNSVQFGYNHNIDETDDITQANVIKRGKFRVQSIGEEVDLPTKYRWVCRHQLENGGECGNVVDFYAGHKHNTITCVGGRRKIIDNDIDDIVDDDSKKNIINNNIIKKQSNNNNNNNNNNGSNNIKIGHILKNIDSIPAFSVRRLFCYYVIFDDDYIYNNNSNINNSGSVNHNEILLYSFRKIEQDIFECNFVYNLDKIPFILCTGFKYFSNDEELQKLEVLSIDDDDDDNDDKLKKKKKNENKILIQNRSKHMIFFNDIYESLKLYYKKYHNMQISNNNKIVGLIMIIQNICKLYLGRRYLSLILGTSGSGKTFFSQTISPMFSQNIKNVMGSSVTMSRFLGGRSNNMTPFRTSLYSPGLIETKFSIVIDEVSEILDNIYNPKIPYNDNLFSWIKMCSDDIIFDRAIQGSTDIKSNAILTLFGNLEQLKLLRDDYKKRVKSKYNMYNNSSYSAIDNDINDSIIKHSFSDDNCIYKSPEYYLRVMNNENLAKAHSIVRKTMYSSNNYITGLATAEMSRFCFFVCLEDEDQGYKKKEYTGDKPIFRQLHRKEFIDELSKYIGNERQKEVPLTEDFKREVWDWMNIYFSSKRNNFRPNINRDINVHIFERITKMITDIMYLDKLYFGDTKLELTDNDKNYIEYFLKYNYNTLGHDEANMSKHPYVNDLLYDSISLDDYDTEKYMNFKSSLLKREEKIKEDSILKLELIDDKKKETTTNFNIDVSNLDVGVSDSDLFGDEKNK